MLADRSWKLKYTPEDGDLVKLFYIPALEDAERYDRLTGYFNAGALALAARGIEGLVRNGGHMRLVVGCTLEPPEIQAIEAGEDLRERVDKYLAVLPLAPPDADASNALELLAWMVACGYLDVKVAVPCDAVGKPVHDSGIFHEKAGIIEDRGGDKIAWNGSLNETAAGWQRNWESINVYTSWGPDPGRVDGEEANFARIWANKAQRVIVLDVPDAARRDLMRFLPASDMPVRLKEPEGKPAKRSTKKPDRPATEAEKPVEDGLADRRSRVWSFIRHAPSLTEGGESVGEATSTIEPWPHQLKAFERLYRDWPPKILIADEVGLGKTIQAGMLLRQAWLAGRAKRILILAPKAVLGQWQIELREKFNLNWPIYDGHKMVRYPSPALRGKHEREMDRDGWLNEPVVIASSQLMRRRDRAAVLLDVADPWDLVVLDEAHHARRSAAGAASEGGPNALLRLMQGLKERTRGLVLLTATPMQVHPIEVWDLLNLLDLPPEWSSNAFLDFFDDIDQPNPSSDAIDRMARLFQSVERHFGEVKSVDAQHLASLSRLKANKVLRALRDDAGIPRRQLENAERRAAIDIMRAHTPIRRLVSRHTRELLRRYFKEGMLSTPIADRRVEDQFIEMTPDERALYDAVEEYIASTYNQADANERTAVGFVMTIYRRRLASSFSALRNTLQRHLDAMSDSGQTQTIGLDEDVPDDETSDEILDADDVVKFEIEALAAEEEADIGSLLDRIGELPPDSKLASLKSVLADLRRDGYDQAMVFTQYTDTMDFLREELRKDASLGLMCFSGRGGEIPSTDGVWRRIGRDDAKRRFREGEADVLLCTDAAAEGLNFQFCGALINYDMPWNPMRVEQRIGRIDRLGQEHKEIRIVNLHYEGTVESDVYRALRNRIGLFETVVGRLQPILARLPRVISEAVLSREDQKQVNVVDDIEQQARDVEARGFDIDAVTDEDLVMPYRPLSPVTMNDLDRIVGSSDLMPPGTDIQPMGRREYGLRAPGMSEYLRVTTDPEYFEEHAESLELWSPGNPLFNPPEFLASSDELPSGGTLKDILDD
ncbi:MAG: SNF2-related protein [Nitrospinae bacterium]|nr:SNF2-related protein [Nitrospinota bacterium]